ncbi:MAG: hypothetical protein JWM91_3240, partial [Rhodospirillales bacterium]|nr:hypothetical protein [Rhodospirillales bacterium]
MLARQFAVGFGVAIVFPLLIYYAVSTFSHPPKWNDFHHLVAYNGDTSPEERTAQQTRQMAENAAYDEAQRVFSLRLLCVAAPLGYAAILLGASRWASGFG